MPRPKPLAPLKDAPRRKRERVFLASRSIRRASAMLIALHVMAFTLVLQLSGIAHLVIDLCLFQAEHPLHAHVHSAKSHDAGDEPDDHPTCPDEGCPPGCASCHCMHVMPVLPAPDALQDFFELPKLVQEIWIRYEGRKPDLPEPAAVYRPPRGRA